MDIFAIKSSMPKIILFLSLVCMAINVMAHPPKKIVLNADPKSKTLKINIAHPVKDSESHFIEKVIVTLNGQVLEEKTFTKQSTAGNEMIVMTIDEMKPGDKIEVECVCNKSGKKKESVEVKSYYTQSK